MVKLIKLLESEEFAFKLSPTSVEPVIIKE